MTDSALTTTRPIYDAHVADTQKKISQALTLLCAAGHPPSEDQFLLHMPDSYKLACQYIAEARVKLRTAMMLTENHQHE